MPAVKVVRRKATWAELMAMKKGKGAPLNDCACGCGNKCRGRFLPGHDSKLRGRLLMEGRQNPPGHPAHEAAKKRMIDLGWLTE